jgi:hypothetical protein
MSVSKMNISHQAGCNVVRARKAEDQLGLRGRFVVEHFRKGVKIGQYEFPNGIANQGKNKLLDIMFHGVSAITTWWLGLIDNASYSALAAADVYAQLAGSNGWREFTDYTDPANADSASTRPEWTEGAAASQAITNASPVVFDITDTGTVKGLFLVGGHADCQTKDNTAAAGGILWATALFNTGDVAVNADDQLKVTYTVSA